MKQSLTNYLSIKYALSGSMEVWHCGRDLKGNGFSLDFLGSGEGMLYLGPGIYFTDNENLARRYAKYHDKAYLYKCSILTDGLYDPNRGEPKHITEKVIQFEIELRKEFGLPENKHLTATDSFKYGKEFIGFLVQKYGRAKAIQVMSDIGINGIYENLPSGALEICIYDMSIIKVISKEEIQYEEPKYN